MRPASPHLQGGVHVTYTYDAATPSLLVDVQGMRTNMTYDTGPVQAEADEPVVIEIKPENKPETQS
jgi:hypothetical protein